LTAGHAGRSGYHCDMTTTPQEPLPDPEVVPSGDPSPIPTPDPSPGPDEEPEMSPPQDPLPEGTVSG